MGNKPEGVARKKNYNEYTIMLVGKMGAGKSSLGNFLLKGDHFEASDSMGRVTDKNMCQCTDLPGDIKLRIIDTPGFGDFRESEEVKRDLADAFYEAKDGVDAFIFVISAAERIGKEMVGQFDMFKKFIDHEHFFDYVIPVFTKVDTRVKTKGVHNSYEQEERIINDELKNEQLKQFNDRIIKRAKQNWICVSSNKNSDEFYYQHIINKLISTIEGIRIRMNGMVCTSLIMEKAKELTDEEKKKEKSEQSGEEIKKLVVGMLIHLILNSMHGEELLNILGDGDDEKEKKGETDALGAAGTT